MATYKELSTVRGPFRVSPKQKKEEPISTYEEYQETFIKALEGYDIRQKKPVRWNFLKDNEGMFQLSRAIDPMMKTNERLYRIVTKAMGDEKPFWTELKAKEFRLKSKERDYIEGFDEIAKGVETGKHGLGLSLGELLFMGTDFLTNANFQRDFQKMMDRQKPDEPETWRGDLAQLMVQYGLPASFISKIKIRAKGLQKVKDAIAKMFGHKASKIASRVGSGAVILGATDFVASPDQRRLGTLFVQPEDTSKLSGRKKAAAMFRNKVRYGAEGAVVGGLFPLAGKTLQQAYKWGARPVGEPVLKMGFNTAGAGFKGASWLLSKNPVLHSQISRSLVDSTKYNVKKMISPMLAKMGYKGLPPFKEWRMFEVSPLVPFKERNLKRIDNILSAFRSFGKQPKDIEGVAESVILEIKGRARKIDKLMEGIEKRAYRLAKKYEQRYNTNKTSKAYEKMLLDDVVDYLSGVKKLGSVEKELRPLAYEIRKDLTKILTEFGKNIPKGTKNEVLADLRTALTGKLDNYLVRSFATFTNPHYLPDKVVRENARNWVRDNVIQRNKDLRETALAAHGKQFPKTYLNKYADDMIDHMLAQSKKGGVNPVQVLKDIGSHPKLPSLRMDKMRFLKTGEELPDVIKKLLGKEKDLRSQVLFTVSDVIASNASKNGFDKIARIGLNNGWLFKTPEQAITKFTRPQQIGTIERLGGLKSNLEQLWTKPEFVKMIQSTGTPLDVIARIPVLRQGLQFKTIVQAGKTLYSPQTQVRNVTSASFFSLWNGHVGHNASVIDSIRIMIKDIFKAGKGDPIDEVEFAKYVEKLVRLGVYDENIVAQELRAVMKNIKDGRITSEEDLMAKVIRGLPTEKVARLYAGGDNLWKGYGFEFFKSDLTKALKNIDDVENYLKMQKHPFSRQTLAGAEKSFDEALDEAAAFMLRNTYPTYSKVPPAVQALRNIPLIGNFVSFPAEMIRTAATSIAMSLRNIGSNNAALRQMGYKNLIGASLAVTGMGKSALAIANFITGNTTEQWDAYKRSGAAPWDRNSNLIGIIPWKDGESAAVNFSYFSPYDVLDRPIQAALTMAEKQNIAPEDTDDYVMSLFFSEEGPLMELIQPFISPAIGFERIQDISSGNFLIGGRTGETAEGFKIYSPTDSLEDKFNKSFAHLVKGIEPGIVSSGRKLLSAIEGDVSGAGKPMQLGDELMALFTGTRVIRIDVKKDLRWRTSNTNRLLRAADETEKFYKAKKFIDRPPSVMEAEFDQMQDEAFKIQRDMYMVLKDFQMLDLSKSKIEDIMIKAGMNKKQVYNLVDGIFTPIKFSEPRFETKVETLKDLAKFKTEKSKNYIYNIRENHVYPYDKLWRIYDDWYGKKLFPDGYKPEEQGAVTNDKGNIVYDENGKIKREPTILEKGWEKIKPLIMPGAPADLRGQAPLPPTPGVNPQLLASANQNVSQTGLTHTENALLSNEEKAMRLRQRGLS
jgi:hypothetical protein